MLAQPLSSMVYFKGKFLQLQLHVYVPIWGFDVYSFVFRHPGLTSPIIHDHFCTYVVEHLDVRSCFVYIVRLFPPALFHLLVGKEIHLYVGGRFRGTPPPASALICCFPSADGSYSCPKLGFSGFYSHLPHSDYLAKIFSISCSQLFSALTPI